MQLPSGSAGQFYYKMEICGSWPGCHRCGSGLPSGVIVFASYDRL